MPADLFTLRRPPGEELPIVANLPHSGLQVPEHIAEHFTPEQLQSLPNSDWHLQELYQWLPALGVTMMQANYSRYVVDLNRALKPPFFGSFWSAVVPEQTAFKKAIYTRKPSPQAVRDRIDEYYTPYHQQLAALLNEKIAQFGRVYLLDLHSFMGLITDDVCLGNANGRTCSAQLMQIVDDSFARQGYQVVQNKVFTGGYITRHYGQHYGQHRSQPLNSQPLKQLEALQIELHYPLYLPDDQLDTGCIPTWQHPTFTQAQQRLKITFQSICAALSPANLSKE
ncbi:MAG: N-formylglutamate amidohydrolase [Cyanobacteria bacterium P01_A01_bin.116]